MRKQQIRRMVFVIFGMLATLMTAFWWDAPNFLNDRVVMLPDEIASEAMTMRPEQLLIVEYPYYRIDDYDQAELVGRCYEPNLYDWMSTHEVPYAFGDWEPDPNARLCIVSADMQITEIVLTQMGDGTYVPGYWQRLEVPGRNKTLKADVTRALFLMQRFFAKRLGVTGAAVITTMITVAIMVVVIVFWLTLLRRSVVLYILEGTPGVDTPGESATKDLGDARRDDGDAGGKIEALKQ